jgi:hypothetical protein
LALDGRANPHISYYDATNGDLEYAHRPGVWRWELAVVDSEGDVGQYTSLALDEGGYPHISYYDATNADLKYAHMDAAGWHVETVDSAGDAGTFTSIALDFDGYPHITYLGGPTGTDLRYAHLGVSPMRNGVQWQTETITSVGEEGDATSLALDVFSSPHVAFSYHDAMSDSVMYAYRGDRGWRTEVVDPNTGRDVSLALDGRGVPHISYGANWGEQQDGLMYAHLSPPSQLSPHSTSNRWTNRVVRHDWGAGFHTSLAVDDYGLPRIAHMVHQYPGNTASLGYSYLDADEWHHLDLDTGYTGGWPSLSIGVDGLSRISYHKFETMDLQYSFVAPMPDCPGETALGQSRGYSALRSMRRVRDEVLAQSAAGQEMTSTYYRHAPELSRILSSDTSLKARTALLLWEFMPGIRGLVSEDGGRQMVLTQRRARRVRALLDDLAVHASPQLQVDLKVLRGIVDRHVGSTLREIWLLEGGSGNSGGLTK